MNSNPRGYIYEMKDMSYSVRFDDISQKPCVRWVHFRNRMCEQYCPTNINTHFRRSSSQPFIIFYKYIEVLNLKWYNTFQHPYTVMYKTP